MHAMITRVPTPPIGTTKNPPPLPCWIFYVGIILCLDLFLYYCNINLGSKHVSLLIYLNILECF